MANVVVVGSQWGDEGKGKIVDWLSERADVVVRFQGGHNAGHTLVIDGTSYKLSLLPSGVVRPGKMSIIGNGVVVDPHALAAEIDRLAGQGVEITRENLRVADNAALILSLHRELDAARETAAAASAIGTTRRGIGPELASWLEESGVPTVLYSNCNVTSLARDLAAMPSLVPVRGLVLDMFPQTAHSEVLLRLTRR